LKLEPSRALVEVLVIDHIDHPTETKNPLAGRYDRVVVRVIVIVEPADC